MASKRKTNEKKKALRQKQKNNRAKKIAFLRSIINRSFNDLKPANKYPTFPDDTFEFILADCRYNQMIQEQQRKTILFRKF